MPAYVLADNKVTNPELYAEYSKLAAPTHALYGGKVLAAGGRTELLGGSWIPNRIVIIEFESIEKAKEWSNSIEYREAKAMRDTAAEVKIIVVEGR
jgi:uncharacterized protein (DUF1330 family)